ncbi:RNA polymerase sigma factor [Marinoscillum furvescens]|nr:sigma-70 family RNA polymerase sigma factor [Marinoscillum furvescens]
MKQSASTVSLSEKMNASTPEMTLEQVLTTYKPLLLKVINSYCQAPEDRDDLMQEISVQVWKSLHRYDGRVKLSTWLYRVALNVAISHHRKQKKETTESLTQVIEAPPPASENPQVAQLHRFINQLDEFNKAIILLYLDDLSHEEISKILGISKSNVGTRIGRIKEKLKQAFTQHKTQD